MLGQFGVQLSGNKTVFSTDATLVVSNTASATPLPATLPLFATGLGALGMLGWRKKRRARA